MRLHLGPGAPASCRVTVDDKFVVRNEATGVESNHGETHTVMKPYKLRDAGIDRFSCEYWSAPRFMLQEFVNRLKGRLQDGSQVWVTGNQTLGIMKMIEMAHQWAEWALPPTSPFNPEYAGREHDEDSHDSDDKPDQQGGPPEGSVDDNEGPGSSSSSKSTEPPDNSLRPSSSKRHATAESSNAEGSAASEGSHIRNRTQVPLSAVLSPTVGPLPPIAHTESNELEREVLKTMGDLGIPDQAESSTQAAQRQDDQAQGRIYVATSSTQAAQRSTPQPPQDQAEPPAQASSATETAQARLVVVDRATQAPGGSEVVARKYALTSASSSQYSNSTEKQSLAQAGLLLTAGKAPVRVSRSTQTPWEDDTQLQLVGEQPA